MLRATFALVVVLVARNVLAAADDTPPRIQHTPPTSAQAGQPLSIEATVEDESGVFEPMLYHRAKGAPTYSATQLVPAGGKKYVAAIVTPASPELEYFIEAFDNKGNGPSRPGMPEQPHRIRIGGGSAPIVASAPEEAPVESAPPPAVDIVSDASGGLTMTEVGGPMGARGPWSYVTLGVGAAAALAGVYFGISARSAAGDWAAATDQAAYKDAESRAQSAATLATVSWIASGAVTAGGAAMFFLTRF